MTQTFRQLPNLNGHGRRAAVERALHLWVSRGVFLYAYEEPERPGRYRVVTGAGAAGGELREWRNLTLKEAELLVHGAASAWQRASRLVVGQYDLTAEALFEKEVSG